MTRKGRAAKSEVSTAGNVSEIGEEATVLHLLPRAPLEHAVRDALVIGRTVESSEGNVLPIEDDSTLSGHHAMVSRSGGSYVLEDLDSTNGTFLRIHGEVELRPGDRFMVGGQVFQFLIE